jgi:hypothetical protein
MPNHDGTGPDGKGPMTGWGRGYCVMPISGSEQELSFLTNQAQVLQKRLKQIKARMKRLERKEIAK